MKKVFVFMFIISCVSPASVFPQQQSQANDQGIMTGEKSNNAGDMTRIPPSPHYDRMMGPSAAFKQDAKNAQRTSHENV